MRALRQLACVVVVIGIALTMGTTVSVRGSAATCSAQCATTFATCVQSNPTSCACYSSLVSCYGPSCSLTASTISTCQVLPGCTAASCGGSGNTGGGTPADGTPSDSGAAATPAPTLPPLTQSEIRGRLRLGLYPVLAIATSVALLVCMCCSIGGGKLDGVAGVILLVAGVVQLVVGVFALFFADALRTLQFTYSAVFTIYAATHSHRLRVLQLLTIVALINFLCLTGNFSLLGWNRPVYDESFSTQQSRCQTRFLVPEPPRPTEPPPPVPAPPPTPAPPPVPPIPPVPPTPPAVCHQYLNVLQAFGYVLTVSQPFVVLFSFIGWTGAT